MSQLIQYILHSCPNSFSKISHPYDTIICHIYLHNSSCHLNTYPVRALGHICSSPSNSNRVLDWFCWHVRASIDAISLVLHLNINRASFSILQKEISENHTDEMLIIFSLQDMTVVWLSALPINIKLKISKQSSYPCIWAHCLLLYGPIQVFICLLREHARASPTTPSLPSMYSKVGL